MGPFVCYPRGGTACIDDVCRSMRECAWPPSEKEETVKTTGTDFERANQKYNQLWNDRDLTPAERWQQFGIWLDQRLNDTTEEG